MATYHVGTGEISGEIYAGTLNKNGLTWKNRTLVTTEAISAVRDHMLNKMIVDNLSHFGYEWKRKDGKKVVLLLSVENGDD